MKIMLIRYEYLHYVVQIKTILSYLFHSIYKYIVLLLDGLALTVSIAFFKKLKRRINYYDMLNLVINFIKYIIRIVKKKTHHNLEIHLDILTFRKYVMY